MFSRALLVQAGLVLNAYRFNSGRGVELRMDKRNRTTTAGCGGYLADLKGLVVILGLASDLLMLCFVPLNICVMQICVANGLLPSEPTRKLRRLWATKTKQSHSRSAI